MERRILSKQLVGILFILVAAQGCERSSTTPLPAPSPTPSPTPEQLVKRTAERMSSLSSLRFQLTHKQGRTALMTGLEAETVDGTVVVPGQASLRVEAVAIELNMFLEINVAIDGAQSFITDPLNGQWRGLPAESLPFNFLDLGVNLGKIVSSMTTPKFTAEKELDGIVVQGVAGTVSGVDLKPLIPSALAEAQVGLNLWIDSDGLLRRVHISGPVIAQDSPDIIRILSFSAFDKPVTITIPK